MRKTVLCLMALVAIASPLCVPAQQPTHPKVLQITREFLKPYRGGEQHDKTESVFATAMSTAHWPTHYLGLNSLTGKSRALYLTTYDSFDAWEKDNAAIMKNPALSAALERASHADGELLESVDQAAFSFDEELSFKPSDDIGHMRFVEAILFHVHPGHSKEFSELVKLAIETHKKAGTTAHWSMWDMAYGGDSDAFLMLSGDKKLAEIDQGFGENKAFMDALGDEGKKKFRELIAASIISSDSQLFAINPHQSYAKDEWVQSDPTFWKPKPDAKPMAKAAMAAPMAKMPTQ